MKNKSLSEIKTIKCLNLRNPLKKTDISKLMNTTNKFITENLKVIQKKSKEDETIERYQEEKNRMMNQKINEDDIIHRKKKLIERKKKNIRRKFQLMKFTLNNNMILDEIMKNESAKIYIINSENNNSNKDFFFVTNYEHLNSNLPLLQKREMTSRNNKYKFNKSLSNKYNNIINKTEKNVTNEKIKPYLLADFYKNDLNRLKNTKRRDIKKLILFSRNDKSIMNINNSGNNSKIKQTKTNINNENKLTSRNRLAVTLKKDLYQYNKINLSNLTKLSNKD